VSAEAAGPAPSGFVPAWRRPEKRSSRNTAPIRGGRELGPRDRGMLELRVLWASVAERRASMRRRAPRRPTLRTAHSILFPPRSPTFLQVQRWAGGSGTLLRVHLRAGSSGTLLQVRLRADGSESEAHSNAATPPRERSFTADADRKVPDTTSENAEGTVSPTEARDPLSAGLALHLGLKEPGDRGRRAAGRGRVRTVAARYS
jgi:hypothetical protein